MPAGPGILAIVGAQQGVPLRQGVGQGLRLDEEVFRTHREELGLVGGGVGVQRQARIPGIGLRAFRIDVRRNRALDGFDGGGETVQAVFQHAAPLARVDVRVGRQRRHPVGLAGQQVQLVREFVDDHIEGAVGARRIAPREDHRPALPGLADRLLDVFVHDAVLVHALALDGETGRVDDDFVPAFVQGGRQVQYRQGGLRGDRQAHEIGDFQPVRAVDVLACQQPCRARLQGLLLGLGQGRQERVGVQRPPPQIGRDAGLHGGHFACLGAPAA